MLVIRRRPGGDFVFEERRPPQQNLFTLVIIALIFLSFQVSFNCISGSRASSNELFTVIVPIERLTYFGKMSLNYKSSEF